MDKYSNQHPFYTRKKTLYIQFHNRMANSPFNCFPFLFFSICLSVLNLAISPVTAQDLNSGSRFDFLNISPSAEQLSLGGFPSATPTASASILSNPALLPLSESSVFDINYGFWIQGFRNQFAAINLRKNNRSVAFSLYSSRTTNSGRVYNPDIESVRYLSLSGAYAYQFGPVTAGLTTQILHEEIQESVTYGIAFTAGLSASLLEEKLRVGLVLANMGKINSTNQFSPSSELPSQFRAGVKADVVQMTFGQFDDLSVMISTHVNWTTALYQPQSYDFTGLMTDDSWTDIGLSVNLDSLIVLHSAFRTGNSVRNVTYGVGFISSPIAVYYSAIPYSGGYGTAHSIGIQYTF